MAKLAPGEAEVDPGMQLVKEIFHRGKISSNNILRLTSAQSPVVLPKPDFIFVFASSLVMSTVSSRYLVVLVVIGSGVVKGSENRRRYRKAHGHLRHQSIRPPEPQL